MAIPARLSFAKAANGPAGTLMMQKINFALVRATI